MKLLKRPKDMGMLLVVGGPGGSGSSTIAKMLAHHFQLHYVYGGAFMRSYAESYGYPDIASFLKSKEFQENRDELDYAVDHKIMLASGWHNVLIDSKIFAALATQQQIPCTAKIWLEASLHTRVRRTLHKEKKVTLDKKIPRYRELYQKTEIKLRDRYFHDKARYKKMYGIDYSRPEKYNDIVIDTSPYNEGETMQIILKKLKDGRYN